MFQNETLGNMEQGTDLVLSMRELTMGIEV